MVKLIAGKKGSGKSKKMIQFANTAVKSSNGNVVFIDDDKRNMYDLNHDIRFINFSEYGIENYDEFTGFIRGILSRDFDISTVYIDGLSKVVGKDLDKISALMKKVEEFSNKHDIDFYLTVSHPITGLPSELEKFLYIH